MEGALWLEQGAGEPQELHLLWSLVLNKVMSRQGTACFGDEQEVPGRQAESQAWLRVACKEQSTGTDHHAVQDLCAPSEPGSREGQALAFWARVCPTNMPKLTALVMPQVKHAVGTC